ncbi:ABC transporter ATP-binding protein [Brevibacillus choshinensis]|uniref:ABC transporter ATP-binding protein n=1 Tax=Brevibacillus choshinensis TaxID=54911 RepID=UPI002E1F1408|nr:ABC transporter ATP-binding protein [Brevibacillus choshinensis]MED4753251.1 ABC transporter ATP-binding protein [Brevibacillus choshinensis]MED4782322.1 ABC transporter ATP-binding protein [Brevibacillus choshinensis]
MLHIHNLEAFYGSSYIIQNISLKVEERQGVALLGRNGAGKSTTLKSIMNIEPKVKGDIHFNGNPIRGKKPYQLARMGLGYVPEDRRIFADLSVVDNLQIGQYGSKNRVTPYGIDEIMELFPLMEKFKKRKGGQLSGGEQQVVSIARTIMAKPKVVLMDEPTEGLAPIIVQSLAESINKIIKELGIGVLLAEQNIQFSRKLTQYVYLIDQGRVIFEGTWDDFDQQPEMREKYLAV